MEDLKYIGMVKNKKVFAIPHAVWRFQVRKITHKEAIEALENPQITYRNKIRSKLRRGKDIFLGVEYEGNRIIIVTVGEK